MSAMIRAGGCGLHEIDDLRQYDGRERIPLLPFARWIAVAPAITADEPAWVFIEWERGVVERPYPGSAIWRAALSRYLESPSTRDPTDPVVRSIARGCLDRFPTISAWLRWADHERELRQDERERRHREREATRRWSISLLWPW